MIKILMLDLGDTLVQEDALFPHVQEALDVLSKFETEAGDPLIMCLVSDYDMPKPPVNERKIDLIFTDYLQMLEKLGLKRFFEPVERRVTLSAHAGVSKPERRVFKKAIERLGHKRARMDECLFITENAEHLAAAGKMGMSVLRFDANDSAEADFNDWSEGPLVVARRVAPKSLYDEKLALQLRLKVAYDIEVVSIIGSPAADTILCRAKRSFPVKIQKRDGSSETIMIPFSVKTEVKLDKAGKVRSIKTDEPDPEAVAESAHYVKTLEDNNQIAHKRGKLKQNQTHEIERDEKGRKRLKRKRFTAI